ncbi:MAG: Gfo/Idh/MocA family oxidoreductase, partial [Candidatus Thorarchaeota archaeon]|nr:Gfo/Idh/MocA family oxidoreductase [Candidatus Thorarchaeota archaeon]NIW13975.1 Gfo/Idh/MocA family oxidoreductase [Candidatus Thorarchaeota archaeon]NIW52111.1 Gfo/Idh/MocA family oxidoreductase [Candidatus Korarchaeota archaeon]
MIIDPGHFHAALSLKEPHRDISSEVFVYAPEGPELDQFLSIVNSFNVRQVNPTQWNLQVYKGKDFLEASTREKKGDIAIIAGKNNTKMDTIQRLHEAGFHILADKPLIISNSKLELLFNTLHKPSPLLMDIMTGRHE